MKWEFYKTTEEAWSSMKRALRRAEHSIFLESYILIDDEAGHEFVNILVEKAQAGLDVKIIFDGFGSWWFSYSTIKRLKKAGAKVLSFQSLALKRIVKSFRRLFHRNHRKILVIDNKIGFIGGVNVYKESRDYYDLHLKIQNKDVVAPMIRSFGTSWVKGGGDHRHVKNLLRHPIKNFKKKFKQFAFIFAHPYKKFKTRSKIRKLYITSLRKARKAILITTPYFLPDKKLKLAFQKAIKRGVRIEVVVPMKGNHGPVNHAMHSMFPELHALGVKFYLLKEMIHAKALVVDHKLGMVGSSNMDSRSLFYNHEANIVFTNREMIGDLRRILNKWKKQSTVFTPDFWKGHSFLDKVLQKIWSIWSPIL